jgi:hypothetical protein
VDRAFESLDGRTVLAHAEDLHAQMMLGPPTDELTETISKRNETCHRGWRRAGHELCSTALMVGKPG